MVYPNSEYLAGIVTDQGMNVARLSEEQPVLLVFLRHFGCTFCREALKDLAEIQHEIRATGTELILVHMSDNDTARDYFARYGLDQPQHISDPSCMLYRAFGLTKGTPRQLFGLQSWIRGFEAGVVNGLGIGPQLGDGFQMPGIFAVSKGKVRASFIHKLASDRPVYLDLVKECCKI